MTERTNLKIGICTRYSQSGASSRLRYYLYRDALCEAGMKPVFHPLLPDEYISQLYGGKGKSKIQITAALTKRLLSSFFLEKNLLTEYELFPLLPAWAELFLIGKRKFVLNFDDLVWEKYRNIPLLNKKFDCLIRHASGVIAANHLLYEKIKELNPNTILIPTVVDLKRYTSAQRTPAASPKLTAAWIGTPVTYRECLLPFAGILKQAAGVMPFRLMVIAKAGLPAIDGIETICVDWSAEQEAKYLKHCDFGIMPLKDDDFSRGKSAYKLIQYAACGLPAIASNVGENCHVIRHGKNGFLASTPEEWISAIKELASAETRSRMSNEMQLLAFDYSLQKYAPVLIEFLRRCYA